jgi:hypothetical protein
LNTEPDNKRQRERLEQLCRREGWPCDPAAFARDVAFETFKLSVHYKWRNEITPTPPSKVDRARKRLHKAMKAMPPELRVEISSRIAEWYGPPAKGTPFPVDLVIFALRDEFPHRQKYSERYRMARALACILRRWRIPPEDTHRLLRVISEDLPQVNFDDLCRETRDAYLEHCSRCAPECER